MIGVMYSARGLFYGIDGIDEERRVSGFKEFKESRDDKDDRENREFRENRD